MKSIHDLLSLKWEVSIHPKVMTSNKATLEDSEGPITRMTIDLTHDESCSIIRVLTIARERTLTKALENK